MMHWLSYLDYFYEKKGYTRPRVIKANVGHDGTAMIKSPQGICAIFNFGCEVPGVLNATSDTPGIRYS